MISLYGYNRSRWIKPYWTLKELGVPFEAKNVRPDLLRAEHPEVVALNCRQQHKSADNVTFAEKISR